MNSSGRKRRKNRVDVPSVQKIIDAYAKAKTAAVAAGALKITIDGQDCGCAECGKLAYVTEPVIYHFGEAKFQHVKGRCAFCKQEVVWKIAALKGERDGTGTEVHREQTNPNAGG